MQDDFDGWWKIVKRIGFIAILVLCICAVGISFLYFLFNSPQLLESNLPRWLNPRLPEIVIQELSIGRQSFSFPCYFHFKDIESQILQGSQKFQVRIREVDLHGLEIFTAQRRMLLQLQGVDVQSDLLALREGQLSVDARFTDRNIKTLQGNFKSFGLNLANYVFTDLKAGLSGDKNTIMFNDFSTDFYDGQIKGQISLDYARDIAYSITMELTKIDLRQLQKVNPEFFSKVRGRVHGFVNAKGDRQGINALEASFDAPEGGEIKASLLQYLVAYIPQIPQRKDLEKLIKTNGQVPLERADVVIKSISDEKISSKIQLESRKFNLGINMTVDTNIEGGLKNLLKYLSNFLQN